ncbi:efflux RND transporter periplasmic adaptor subunit [Pseudochelatococcus contaminans]|uniref:Membrane fusion protein (Multidrug efflux system) n=1 Tax=Pseudochelatococcus contaminans TaxID=1538103 RepID=A0A7W5Z6C9_9HYPH|nr:efflux RND transporter periplasmic adaptor subunit [Pseudochelatococcus contaminans]MBB3811016.1 membrane fusion protein (multidrug efflux system) [Pseudochelatococcus contaminans]
MHVPSSLRAFLVGMSLLSPLALAACSDESQQQQQGGGPAMPPMPVGIVTVEAEAIPIVNELPGRIRATRIAEVRPRVSGILIERVFTQGGHVDEGDVLYRIDPEPFRLEVERAEAAMQRAEATQLRANQEADRVKELQARKVASTQALENSVAGAAQAAADVASARAALSTAKLNLEYTEVKAPISGRIGRALITEGALVSSTSQEPLALIQQLDPIYADFTQSVNDQLNLRRAAASGTITGASETEVPVRLLFDDGTPYEEPGRLLFSESTVDATTGQVTMRAQFPNPKDDLLPGMYVRVQVEQGIENAAIAVPQQAIQRDTGGQALIYVVDDESKIAVRPVKTGRIIGGRWVISEGLNSGDRVVVEGFQKVRPGAPVAASDWKPREAVQAAAEGQPPAATEPAAGGQ